MAQIFLHCCMQKVVKQITATVNQCIPVACFDILLVYTWCYILHDVFYTFMNNRRKYWIFCLDTARITESIIKKTPSKNRNCLLLLGILAVEYCCRFSLIFSYPKLNCESGERKSSMIYSCDVKLAFFIEFYRVLCSQI